MLLLFCLFQQNALARIAGDLQLMLQLMCLLPPTDAGI
jgi:hypothetical protein